MTTMAGVAVLSVQHPPEIPSGGFCGFHFIDGNNEAQKKLTQGHQGQNRDRSPFPLSGCKAYVPSNHPIRLFLLLGIDVKTICRT